MEALTNVPRMSFTEWLDKMSAAAGVDRKRGKWLFEDPPMIAFLWSLQLQIWGLEDKLEGTGN